MPSMSLLLPGRVSPWIRQREIWSQPPPSTSPDISGVRPPGSERTLLSPRSSRWSPTPPLPRLRRPKLLTRFPVFLCRLSSVSPCSRWLSGSCWGKPQASPWPEPYRFLLSAVHVPWVLRHLSLLWSEMVWAPKTVFCLKPQRPWKLPARSRSWPWIRQEP